MNIALPLRLFVASALLCEIVLSVKTDDDLWPQLGDDSDISVEGQDFERILLKNLLENRPKELSEKDLPGFIHDYLDGVMVRFRSRVTSLYRKMTCARGQCDLLPYTAGHKNHQDPFEYPSSSKLEIIDSRPVHNCHIPNPVSSYLVFRESTTTLLVVAFAQLPVISLYELRGNAQCMFLDNYDSSLSPTFLKTRYGGQQFLFVGSSSEGVDIYSITKSSLELMQPLEIPKFRRMFDLGSKICLVTGADLNSERCKLYEFQQVSYEEVGTFNLHLGASVDHFNHKKDSFVVSANYSLLDYSAVTVWKFEGLQLILYQILSECDAKQVKYFTVTGLKFLAVVCRGDESYIYWWSGSQFLMKQMLITPGAISWMPFALNNEDGILVLHSNLKSNDRLDVYQYVKGFYQLHLEIAPTPEQSFHSVPEIGAQVVASARGYLVTVLQMLKGQSYFVSHSLQVGLGTKRKDGFKTRNIDCAKDLKDDLNKSESRIKNLAESILQLRLRIADGRKMVQSKSFSSDVSCDYIQSKLDKIEGRLARSNHRSNELASDFKIQQNEIVSVGQISVSGILSTNNIVIQSGTVNGVDFKDLHNSVLSKSADQTIDGTIVLSEGLSADYLDVSYVNGIRVEDNLALRNRRNVFTRPQQFVSINTTNAVVESTVNNLLTDDIFLKHRRQSIGGKKTFRKMAALKNVHLVDGLLNGVNLKKFPNQVLKVHGDQTINSPVTFKGDVVIGGNLESPTINAIDIRRLANDVITTDTPQIIKGNIVFNNDLIINTATLAGSLNGVDLSTLLTRDTEQTISNSVEIKGDVKVIGDVTVQTTVNGMDISEVLVTRCGNHTITATKNFTKDISVDEFAHLEAEKKWHHYGDLRIDTLNVAEINGVNVNRLLHRVVRRTKPQTFQGRLMCDHISFSDIVTNGKINNGSMKDTYLTIATDQVVHRPVEIQNGGIMFTDDVTVENGRTLNGVDVSVLDSSVVKVTGDQIIRGHKVFKKVRAERGINVISSNYINEHFLTHALAKGDRKLETLTVSGNLEIDGTLKADNLNGVPLSPLLQEIGNLYDPLAAIKRKSFRNLTVLGNLYIDGSINNVNLNQFFKSVFRLSSNQEISGDLTLSKPTTFHHPLFAKNVNGRDLNSVKELVQVDDNNAINSPVKFRHGLAIERSLKVDYLNSKNFSYFASSLLLNNRHQRFSEPGFIDGNVYVGNVKVMGEVNGRNLSDLVLLTENITLNHQVQFKAPMTFTSLTVDGSLNVAQNDLHRHHYSEIVAKSVKVQGKLSGLDISELVANQQSADLISGVRFGNGVTVGDLVISDGLINDVNLADIRKRAFTKNTRQTISGRKSFLETAIFRDIFEVEGHVTSDNVEGIKPDMHRAESLWEADHLFRDGNHYGNIHLRGGLSVAGKSKKADADLFSVLKIDGDLAIDRLKVAEVNGINLQEFVSNRVTLTTSQSIHSEVEFMDFVDVRGSVRCFKPTSKLDSIESATISSDDLLNGISDWKTTGYYEDFESGSSAAKFKLNETESSISFDRFFQMQNQASNCASALLQTAKGLSGIIYDFKMMDQLPSVHAIDYMVQGDEYLNLVMATPTISSTMCSNVQVLRCDADLDSCQPFRSPHSLPVGFVRDVRTYKIDSSDIFVYLVETRGYFPPSLDCAGRQPVEGVFIVVSGDKAYSGYEVFIPEERVSSVSVFKSRSNGYNFFLSSEYSGTSIHSINNETYKVLFRGAPTTRNSISTRSKGKPEIYLFSLTESEPAQLIAQTWNTQVSRMIHETRFALDLSNHCDCVAAFSRRNTSFVVVGNGRHMSVFQYDGQHLLETQKINKNVKSLQILSFKGRTYLTALTTHNEVILYRWTDLLNFVAVGQFLAPSEVTSLRLFSRGEQIYLAALPVESNSRKNLSTLIYKAMVTGLGHATTNC